MSERTLFSLTLAAAIGSGLVAGVFFAFSTFVMPALGHIAPASGIAAMQAINITVINPLFMLAFLGTALLCLGLGFGALLGLHGGHPALPLLAAAVYLVACLGVTLALNVPLNDALAAARPDTPAAAELWSHYLAEWTAWNHVRMLASLASAVLFTLALA